MVTVDPGSVSVTRYAYGSHPEQFGELRVPAGSGPHPSIVYVHGGGWAAAITLAGAAGICAALAARGFATWSIEYRRIGNGGGWPATFDDVQAGAAFLQSTLAADNHLDLSRVFTGGQSAGGQLAFWLASRTTGQRDSRAQALLPTFRGVLALAPATDLRQSASRGGAIVDLLGGSPNEVSDRYAATSPVELVPLGLPQLVVHGTADTVVPYALSEAYVRAARSAGDDVELVTIDGANHLDLWQPASCAFPSVVDAATRFLSSATAPATR